MIGRRLGALAGAALVLAGCGSSGSAGLPRDTRCGHSPNGVVCVQVHASGNAVGNVFGFYSPATSLRGLRWRLNLVRYDCDPAASETCRPTAQYPTTTRHTPPPVDGTCIAVLYDAGRQQCTDRLAEAVASFGDFEGLPALPSAQLGTHTWLCVSAQLVVRGGWHDEFARSAACFH